MPELRQKLRKYFIMGSQNCTGNPVEILKEAIDGGITAFQYREKGTGSLTGQAKLKLGKQLREMCRNNGVLFFVNDDVELVVPLDADGIHVGQDDTPIDEIQRQFPNKIIGLSVSNNQEVTQSPIELIDYIGAGPIYATGTKEDAKTPVGVKWIHTLRNRFPLLPIVGIGGITTNNASSVIEAGADGVSIISAITEAKDIKKAVEKL